MENNLIIRGPPLDSQGGGGRSIFEINNFGRTLREINNFQRAAEPG